MADAEQREREEEIEAGHAAARRRRGNSRATSLANTRVATTTANTAEAIDPPTHRQQAGAGFVDRRLCVASAPPPTFSTSAQATPSG